MYLVKPLCLRLSMFVPDSSLAFSDVCLHHLSVGELANVVSLQGMAEALRICGALNGLEVH